MENESGKVGEKVKYKVCLSTKVKPEQLKKGSGIIVIEPDDYTNAQVKAIKSKGYKVLAYLSIGTIEKERPWFKQFEKYKRKRLEDWPNEYYMDMKKIVWKRFLVKRAAELKKRGFDGWWLDNLDVYEEYKSKAEYTSCYAILKAIRNLRGYVMVNGGSGFLDDTIDKSYKPKILINGYTQEEVFSRILDYSGKGKFGKQKKEDKKFYRGLIKKLRQKGVDCFLLEYTRDKTLAEAIKKWCKTNKVNYCISEDVNL